MPRLDALLVFVVGDNLSLPTKDWGSLARLDQEKQKVSAVGSGSGIPGFPRSNAKESLLI